MFKKITKRIFPVILAIILIVSVTPVYVFAGTTVNMLDNTLALTDTASSTYSKRISVSGTQATLKAVGGWLSAETNTITILNKSNSPATLTFDYEITNISNGSVSIDGTPVETSTGGFSKDLTVGASIDIVIKANKSKTVTVTLNKVALTAITGSHDVTVNYDSSLGSVTMNGNAVASGTTQNVESVALVATASSGSTFLGWIDENTKQIISESATYTHYPLSAVTLKAVFVNSSSPAYFRVDGTYSYLYTDLNAASDMAATVSKKLIILANNGTLAAGDYTIDAGVTLLIPFDSANTLYTDEPGRLGAAGIFSEDPVQWSQPTVYRKLTMESGANITVDGAISLSAKHANPAGAKPRGAGSPSGPCSYIYMEENSNITVNGTGSLYAWGYIYGKGSVYAKSGANIYENFQFEDFRGGTQTTDNEMKNHGVFPLSQYYIQNIEVPMTIESGAKESCYTSIYMKRMAFGSDVGFFSDGTSDGSMFNLTKGTVTKRYDPATDRLIVELNGDMTISPISMSIGGTNFNSKDFVLPVNSNITIIANEGSNVTMTQSIAILPGASIVVKEGATAKLKEGVSVYLYDSEQWGNFAFTSGNPANAKFVPLQYSPGRTYTRTEADLVDATVEVNGVLDATQGNIYTTAGGGNIYSTANGVVKMGNVADSVTYQLVQGAGYTEIPVASAKLLNGDGSYLQTGEDNYIYTNNKWNCENHIGTAATCTEDGVCEVCGNVEKAKGHTYTAVVTAPTCTEQGFTTYTCACGDTYVDNYVDAKGHTAGADATCTENQVCTVCGAVLVEAHGHSYSDEWTIDLEPTHTTDGSKSHHCTVCGDKTDITVIEAYGYDINGNGETEITDYYYMKHLILGSAKYDEADLPRLDFNGDKKFDILDLIKYYTILQGMI